jgi:hypothetical protein
LQWCFHPRLRAQTIGKNAVTKYPSFLDVLLALSGGTLLPEHHYEKLRTFPTHHLRRQGFVLWQVLLPVL